MEGFTQEQLDALKAAGVDPEGALDQEGKAKQLAKKTEPEPEDKLLLRSPSPKQIVDQLRSRGLPVELKFSGLFRNKAQIEFKNARGQEFVIEMSKKGGVWKPFWKRERMYDKNY